jgi:hypothetical protein
MKKLMLVGLFLGMICPCFGANIRPSVSIKNNKISYLRQQLSQRYGNSEITDDQLAVESILSSACIILINDTIKLNTEPTIRWEKLQDRIAIENNDEITIQQTIQTNQDVFQ